MFELLTTIIIVIIGAKLIDIALGGNDSNMKLSEKAYWWGRLIGQIILPALTALVLGIMFITAIV